MLLHRASSLLGTAVALASTLALAACGGDDSGDRDATGGSSGAGGPSTGGTSSTGGASGGGMPAGGGSANTCSNGCAELKVPFTAYNTAQAFEIYLPAMPGPVDFSTAVVSVKLRTIAGEAGGIQVVIKNPAAKNYAWAQTAWLGIADTVKEEWTTVTLDAAAPDSSDTTNMFDNTQVSIIAVQLAAGDPWYSDDAKTVIDQAALVNPTIVQIDEISVSGATGVGPFTFTANATDLKIGTYQPVTGSAVGWLPPSP